MNDIKNKIKLNNNNLANINAGGLPFDLSIANIDEITCFMYMMTISNADNLSLDQNAVENKKDIQINMDKINFIDELPKLVLQQYKIKTANYKHNLTSNN